jgi:hypothetical protein
MTDKLAVRVLNKSIRGLLPVDLAAVDKARPPRRLFLTLSMQRSGQHLIIRWLCQNLGDVVHFNFCHFQRSGLEMLLTPRTGRRVIYQGDDIDDSGIQTASDLCRSLPSGQFASLLYSVEDHDPGDPLLRRVIQRYRQCTRVLVILRDPYNWLASTMKLRNEPLSALRRKVERYKRYLKCAMHDDWPFRCPVTVIKYDQFVLSEIYRRQLAKDLKFEVLPATELGLQDVPAFGGGSSFTGTRRTENHQALVFERWRHCVDDPHYQALVQDPELTALGSALFPENPSLAPCRSALGLRTEWEATTASHVNPGTER